MTIYLSRLLIAFLSIALLPLSWAEEYAWPVDVVTVEDIGFPQMKIDVPRARQRGDVKGPAVLKVHVDKEGAERRAVLFESSGSPGHDEAAMHP